MTSMSAYRSVLRELRKASIAPPPKRNKAIASQFRLLFQGTHANTDAFNEDVQNAITFMRSQRTYKELLDRYNPLIDLTGEERIEATARRVGLDMPLTHKGDDKQ